MMIYTFLELLVQALVLVLFGTLTFGGLLIVEDKQREFMKRREERNRGKDHE